MRPGRGQHSIERVQGGAAQLRQLHVDIGGEVGRHRAGSAAIGNDGQAVALRQASAADQARGKEQLGIGGHPYHAAAAQRGIEDRVVADQGAGMAHRCARAGQMASGLENHDRLGAGCRTQSADEAACVMNALDIQQDGLRGAVMQQVIKDLAEVDIDAGTHGHHTGEAHPGGTGPVHQRGGDGPGLRHQRHAAGQGLAAGKAGIEADRWPHDAKAIRADQTHLTLLCRLMHLLLQQSPGRAGFAEAGREHHGIADAGRAGIADDLCHGRRRCRHHHQIDRAANVTEACHTAQAGQHIVSRVDGMDCSLEARFLNVFKNIATQAASTVARAHERHRGRGEQGLQIVAVHGAFRKLDDQSW